MALCAGMGVPGRMKYRPADDSYDTDPQNDESRIIFKDIIKESWGARKKRQVELRGEALADESKGPEREDHETGEKQNVQDAGSQIARLPILTESIDYCELDPFPNIRKPMIRHQFSQEVDAAKHDVREKRDSRYKDY